MENGSWFMVSSVRGRCCLCVPVDAAHTRSAGSRCHVVVGVGKHKARAQGGQGVATYQLCGKKANQNATHTPRPAHVDITQNETEGSARDDSAGRKQSWAEAYHAVRISRWSWAYRWYAEPAIRSFLYIFLLYKKRFLTETIQFPLLLTHNSTCPPLSSSPHAHSFVIGPAVIKHTHIPLPRVH